MTADDRPTATSIAHDAATILGAVDEITASGGPATLGALRQRVEAVLTLRLSEYISFLDRFQLLAFRRSDGTVSVTEGGRAAVAADRSGLEASVRDHFGDRVGSEAEALESPKSTESPGEERKVAHEERFERGEALGAGGLSVVYLATQRSLDRQVVLKEFRDIFQYFTPAQRETIVGRLSTVVRRQARLCHPNIVRVLDFDGASEFPTVAVEYQPGGNLRDCMNSGDRMPSGVAIHYFLQIAEALRYAHAQGVVHRNLKPENILLDSMANAVVSDFGLTKIVEPDDDQIRQVYVGVGTVAYLAPEQYQDARKASVQGDIYSLGIMLYEMLTGKLPGRRSPMPSAYYDDIPRELDDVFDRMTLDYLDQRYESMDQALGDVYDAEDIVAVRPHEGPAATGATPEVTAAPVIETEVASEAFGTPEEAEGVAEAFEESSDPPSVEPEATQSTQALGEEAPPEPSVDEEPASGGGVADRISDLAGDLFGD